MTGQKFYGIHGDGRILCPDCAEELYGTSLESYLSSGDIDSFSEFDRPTYAGKGLLCDQCFGWVFPPKLAENPWWLEEPNPDEDLRLLAPFASFLETLQIDVANLRNIVTSRL